MEGNDLGCNNQVKVVENLSTRVSNFSLGDEISNSNSPQVKIPHFPVLNHVCICLMNLHFLDFVLFMIGVLIMYVCGI